MSETPENLDKKQGKNRFGSLKKDGRGAKDVLYDIFGSEKIKDNIYTYNENGRLGLMYSKNIFSPGKILTKAEYYDFKLCCDKYIWAFTGKKWRLLDEKGRQMTYEKNGATMVLEVDEVQTIGRSYGFKYSTPEGRVFRIGSEWGVVLNNGTFVIGNYIDMHLYSIVRSRHEYTFAVGTEVLENGEEKRWAIDTETGSISEYDPSSREDSDKEGKINDSIEKGRSFHENLSKIAKETGIRIRDTFYNNVLKGEFNLNINGKVEEFKSYMKDGKVGIEGLLDPKYEELEPCSYKYIWMREGNKRGLIDLKGKVLIEPEFDKVDKNMYKKDNKRGFIDENGKPLGAKYDSIKGNKVMVGDKVGLVDIKTGKELIKPIYDDINVLLGGLLAKVRLGDKVGLVDIKTGKEIIKPIYDDIHFLRGGLLAEVLLGNKVGLVNIKTGKEIIKPIYDDIDVLDGLLLAKVRLGKKCGLFSILDGSLIKNVEYDAIDMNKKTKTLSFNKGHVIVEKMNYSIYEKNV